MVCLRSFVTNRSIKSSHEGKLAAAHLALLHKNPTERIHWMDIYHFHLHGKVILSLLCYISDSSLLEKVWINFETHGIIQPAEKMLMLQRSWNDDVFMWWGKWVWELWNPVDSPAASVPVELLYSPPSTQNLPPLFSLVSHHGLLQYDKIQKPCSRLFLHVNWY